MTSTDTAGAANTTISASPISVPADGVSTSLITVRALYGNDTELATEATRSA